MLDEALLRPGRLEVHVEIGLPDEQGRLQILKVQPSLHACCACPMRGSSRKCPSARTPLPMHSPLAHAKRMQKKLMVLAMRLLAGAHACAMA